MPSIVGLAVRRRSSKKTSGSALTSWPISMSSGLIGVPATSLTTRMPLRQTVCVELVARQRAEVAQQHDRRAGRARRRRRAACCGSAGGGRCRTRSTPGRARRRSPRGPRRWRRRGGVLDDLVVAHQLAGPLDGADADAAAARGRGQRRARRWRRRGRRWCRVVADVEDEVGDAGTATAKTIESPNSVATCRSARFSALRVDVGRPRLVRRAARGRRSARRRSPTGVRSPCAWSSARSCRSRLRLLLATRAVWAAIQTAKPTRAPMPTSQANRPSLTGPRPPRPKPP